MLRIFEMILTIKFYTMRTLFLLIVVLICKFSIGQDIVEIPFKALDEDYIELVNAIQEIENSESKQVINLEDKDFEKFNDLDTRFLMFWALSFHYSDLKEYEKCFEILKKGQSEGFFFVLDPEHDFPSYLKEIEKFDGYQSFVEQNQSLIKETDATTNTEYMVQLPEEYDENKNYPLFLIMHGGAGCIPSMQYRYISEKLKKEFIVAYFQGSSIEGSYSRSFSRTKWSEQVNNGYKQIISKYPVDTSEIILSGPSSGGGRSIILGINNIVPASGLLLNFSVIPRGLSNDSYVKSAERGLKVVQLCCENDWGIQQQKEFGYWLDKYTIKNRFLIFPDKGHEYPANFQHHLDTSIEFLLKKN